jgi:iron(III) transport system substrate-binding protein
MKPSRDSGKLSRRSFLVGASALVLGGVTGCATTSVAATPTRSASTETLTVLGTADEEYVRGMCRAFEVQSGIRTTYQRKSAGEALDLLRVQKAAPQFSVWWGGSADGYIAAKASGVLERYEPKGAAAIPRRFKDPDGAWTGVYVGVLGLAANLRLLGQLGLPVPATWADLAGPIYAGQLALGHPATSGTAYTMLATIAQLDQRDLERTFAYFGALHLNLAGRPYEVSGAATPRLAAQGKAALGVAFAHDVVAAIEDGGADLRVIYPADGTGYEIGGMALVRGGPSPDLGRRFLDWAVSAPAQELGPLFTAYQIPTNPDARVPPQSVRLASVKTIDYDFAWAGANRDALVDRFNRTIAPPPA